RSSICWPGTRLHVVSTRWRARRLDVAPSARLFTPGFTVLHDTVADTTTAHWTNGRHGSPIAFVKDGPCSRISTMTPAATRRATRYGFDNVCRHLSHDNPQCSARALVARITVDHAVLDVADQRCN